MAGWVVGLVASAETGGQSESEGWWSSVVWKGVIDCKAVKPSAQPHRAHDQVLRHRTHPAPSWLCLGASETPRFPRRPVSSRALCRGRQVEARGPLGLLSVLVGLRLRVVV